MKLFVGCVCIVAAFFVANVSTAEAKGIAIINTGEDVVEVGQIKPELRTELEANTAPGVKLGMMYSRFGLFWLDIWRWDKKYALYADNSVWQVTEEQAKEIATSIDVPFTMTIPPGLIVLIALVGVIVLAAVFGRNKDATGELPAEQQPPPDPA